VSGDETEGRRADSVPGHPCGRIAFDDTGTGGPVVALVPGLGDSRRSYRFLQLRLGEAGYRAVTVDLRGLGESTVAWRDYTQTAIGGLRQPPDERAPPGSRGSASRILRPVPFQGRSFGFAVQLSQGTSKSRRPPASRGGRQACPQLGTGLAGAEWYDASGDLPLSLQARCWSAIGRGRNAPNSGSGVPNRGLWQSAAPACSRPALCPIRDTSRLPPLISADPRRGDPGAVREDTGETDAGGDPCGGWLVSEVADGEPGACRNQDHVARGGLLGLVIDGGTDRPAENVEHLFAGDAVRRDRTPPTPAPGWSR
jgi:hypothetical protein